MSLYIQKLISEGEHQQLDFKFEISDSKKIARTIVAFANTDGGKLLIGVKDNGVISGIRYEEEYHMVEAAAEMYCRPRIGFESYEWDMDGRRVLEVSIPKSERLPHYAPDKNGDWKAYIRVGDQNLLANDVLINVWKRKRKKTGVKLQYSDIEKKLLSYLENNHQITLTRFCKIAGINRFLAKKVLVNLILIQVIDIVFTEEQVYYKLSSERAIPGQRSSVG